LAIYGDGAVLERDNDEPAARFHDCGSDAIADRCAADVSISSKPAAAQTAAGPLPSLGAIAVLERSPDARRFT
jgi:hypothetical protein